MNTVASVASVASVAAAIQAVFVAILMFPIHVAAGLGWFDSIAASGFLWGFHADTATTAKTQAGKVVSATFALAWRALILAAVLT